MWGAERSEETGHLHRWRVFSIFTANRISKTCCCRLLAREMLSLSLSVHMAFCKARAIEGTTGTARQVLLWWLPGDCIPARFSSASSPAAGCSSWGCRLCLPWKCSSGQSGRLHSGPGMAETVAQESPTLGCWGVLRWISDSDTGAELLLYRHNWAFVPHSPLFPPDLCVVFCLPKLPYLQLQRLWQSWVWVLSQLESSCRALLWTLHPESWGTKDWR